jgi:Protein of unknown function (DUF3141)
MRAMHPNRLRFSIFSDQNPFMQLVKAMAAEARARRRPVAADNPFLAWEKAASDWITTCLQSWGEVRDAMIEAAFLNAYGSPLLQAIVASTPSRMQFRAGSDVTSRGRSRRPSFMTSSNSASRSGSGRRRAASVGLHPLDQRVCR